MIAGTDTMATHPPSRRRRVLPAVLVVALLLAGYSALTSGDGDYSPDRQGDIAWLAERLPRLHKNLFFSLPEAEYRRMLDDLRARAEGLDREHYFVALAQIVAAVGDGHTSVSPWEPGAGVRRLPVSLFMFAEGLYIVGAAADLPDLVGCRVVSIGGIAADEVIARVATLVAKENEASVIQKAPGLIAYPEILYGLDVLEAKDRAPLVLEDQAGNRFERTLEAREQGTFGLGPGAKPPLWWGNNNVLWHRYLEGGTLYIQYNQCSGDLAAETARIVATLNEHPVERIVLDLRRNGGGDSRVAGNLIDTLAKRPEVREPGHLFVIVGRATFSSAILNSYEIKAKSNAVFFGEPTAGRPNHYGEVKTAGLPFSGFRVSYSVKYFRMVQDDDPASLVPEHTVEQSAALFFAGRDPVLEAILAYK